MRIIFYVCVIIPLCFPATALAYIDPGIGSLLLQGLAAAVISALIFWRSLREKIKKLFRGSKTDKSNKTDEQS